MRYYVVIDTNVLVSALLKPDSFPGTVLSLVMSDTIKPVVNTEITAEYKNVLHRSKFPFKTETVDTVLRYLEYKALFIDPERINIYMPDIKDKVFYEVTMEKRKTDDAYLVTGNIKHFPAEYFIVTPKELIEMIGDSMN